MKEGDFVKVHLPGESPWAICRHVYNDGTFEGEINNKLVGEASEEERVEIGERLAPGTGWVPQKLHGYRCGQVVRFKLEVGQDYSIWVPAEGQAGTA